MYLILRFGYIKLVNIDIRVYINIIRINSLKLNTKLTTIASYTITT